MNLNIAEKAEFNPIHGISEVYNGFSDQGKMTRGFRTFNDITLTQKLLILYYDTIAIYSLKGP